MFLSFRKMAVTGVVFAAVMAGASVTNVQSTVAMTSKDTIEAFGGAAAAAKGIQKCREVRLAARPVDAPRAQA
jgi:hypothetical protein